MKIIQTSLAIAAALIGSAALAQTPVPPPAPAAVAAANKTPAVSLPTAGAVEPPASVPVVSESDASFMKQQSSLTKEVRILKLQAQVADLQKSIADSKKSTGAPVSAAPSPTAPVSLSAAAAQPISSITLPVDNGASRPSRHHVEHGLSLAGVVVVGARGQATIVDDGVSYDVNVGSVLPSGWRVNSIAADHVEVARGGVRRSLRIGG